MTKEKLITWIEQYSGMGNISVNTVKKLLNEFFESNVCIPKGENKLPILPALFACKHTGKNDEYKIVTIVKYIPNNGYYEYHDVKGNSYCIAIFLESIKPSEPIYEWQWIVITNKMASFVGDGRYHTEYELKSFPDYIKIEETKRERK